MPKRKFTTKSESRIRRDLRCCARPNQILTAVPFVSDPLSPTCRHDPIRSFRNRTQHSPDFVDRQDDWQSFRLLGSPRVKLDFCFQDLGFCNAIGIDELSASGLGLGQNYPNPFNGHTTIEYQLPVSGQVQLIFSDAVGRMIRTYHNSEANQGTYTVEFNSQELKPGIYFYTLIFNGERITKRMVVTN